MAESYPNKEIKLGVKPFPQPLPTRNPGGDCFCCAFTAGVNYFYPEKPISFDEMYECFMCKDTKGNPALANGWIQYKKTFEMLNEKGYNFANKPNIVLPDFSMVDTWSYSWYQFNNHHVFFGRVWELLSNDYLLIFNIDDDGKGSLS